MGKRKVPETEGTSNPQLKFKSPAEFFAENKNIAGFDNPGKSLYTTIRELVENGLDAAEAVPLLPEIEVVVEELTQTDFNRVVGLHELERVDESLYKDVETEKERKQRQAKEKRLHKRRKGSGAAIELAPAPSSAKREKKEVEALDVEVLEPITQKTEEDADIVPVESSPAHLSQTEATLATQSQPASQPPVSQAKVTRGETSILKVTVKDNGIGMKHNDVPDMLGRVLAGTKYCVKQSRGKFGLGSKMALIWSKMSTSLPVEIQTAQEDNEITHCTLDIDISRNTPHILVHEKHPNPDGWRGTQICVTIEGSWTTYRAKILHYMRQLAIVTPYAQFGFRFVTARTDRSFEVTFQRRSEQMPPEPTEVKHHPSSVNQLLLKQLISDVDAEMTIIKFLTSELSSIDRDLAKRLVKELGSDFRPDMPVSELGLNEIRRLDMLLKGARFPKANGDCLSPAGEYNLRLGIIKELKPTMVATHAEPADVFEGHPFIVEVGLSLGGEHVKPGLNIYRFANRIPLLFEAGNDVVSKTAKDSIAWSQYKISGNQDRIGVFCSIVSTRIPFKGTGKEYIGDDATEIKVAVKRALQSCCVQLKTKISRKAEIKSRQERKRNLRRYAPDVASALTKFLEGLENPTVAAPYVQQLQDGVLSRDILHHRLIQHVEASDRQQALEHATATGRDEKNLTVVFPAPRMDDAKYVHIVPAAKAPSAEARPPVAEEDEEEESRDKVPKSNGGGGDATVKPAPSHALPRLQLLMELRRNEEDDAAPTAAPPIITL